MLYNIYFSPTGGTKKVADILVGNLGGEVCEVDICCDITAMSLQAEDVCLVSVPSFAGRVPQIAVERIKKISGNGAKAILNCVYGNREWDDTLTELQDTLEACGFVCVAAVAAVAEHSIFRQFAAGRPDADDAKELAEFARDLPVFLQFIVRGKTHKCPVSYTFGFDQFCRRACLQAFERISGSQRRPSARGGKNLQINILIAADHIVIGNHHKVESIFLVSCEHGFREIPPV